MDDLDAGIEDAWGLPADFNAKAPYGAWGQVFDALLATLRSPRSTTSRPQPQYVSTQGEHSS
ncbi:hypothetical protein AB0942_09930 [Streptomyces nodosus]|uniref:hypothetical protein n=1 Tax=Streptomyces nodosus TaxID=40318 RepID=UPI003456375F